MRFVSCHACRHAVQIGGKPDEVEDLLGSAESFPCITPLCRGRMLTTTLAKVPGDYRLREMPLANFYRAVNGLGSGVGAPASLKRLRHLLLSQRVVDLLAESVGQPERVIVREMILESGVHLHFETSAKGACIYYIEEPENERTGPADATAEGDDSNREEAGRAPQNGSGGSQGAPGADGLVRASGLPDAERLPSVPEAGDVRPDDVPRPPESDSGSGVRV